jgi:hypothetical protein
MPVSYHKSSALQIVLSDFVYMKLHYKKNRSAVPYTCGRVHSVGSYMELHYKKNKSTVSYNNWQKKNLTPNFRLT